MIKPISRQKALVQLTRITDGLRTRVINGYEHRAKNCGVCETPGACCLDAHFVNVRISRLEAVRIARAIDQLAAIRRQRVIERIDDAIEAYGLDDIHDGEARTFACPLFEPDVGCLVHGIGKPVPCIIHACYDNVAHLPPDSLQDEAELAIARLNRSVYGTVEPLLPLPVAIKRWTTHDAA